MLCLSVISKYNAALKSNVSYCFNQFSSRSAHFTPHAIGGVLFGLPKNYSPEIRLDNDNATAQESIENHTLTFFTYT